MAVSDDRHGASGCGSGHILMPDGSKRRESLCVDVINSASLLKCLLVGFFVASISAYVIYRMLNYKVAIVVFIVGLLLPYILADEQPFLIRVVIRHLWFSESYELD